MRQISPAGRQFATPASTPSTSGGVEAQGALVTEAPAFVIPTMTEVLGRAIDRIGRRLRRLPEPQVETYPRVDPARLRSARIATRRGETPFRTDDELRDLGGSRHHHRLSALEIAGAIASPPAALAIVSLSTPTYDSHGELHKPPAKHESADRNEIPGRREIIGPDALAVSMPPPEPTAEHAHGADEVVNEGPNFFGDPSGNIVFDYLVAARRAAEHTSREPRSSARTSGAEQSGNRDL